LEEDSIKGVNSMKQTGHKNSNTGTILAIVALVGGISVLISLWLCLAYPLTLFTFATTTYAPQPGIQVKLLPPGMWEKPGVWNEPDSWEETGLIMLIVNPVETEKYGTMILNDVIVDFQELLWNLQNAPNEAKRMLIIKSERNVLHEQMVMVADMAKRAGVREIAYLPLTHTLRRVRNQITIQPRPLIRQH